MVSQSMSVRNPLRDAMAAVGVWRPNWPLWSWRATQPTPVTPPDTKEGADWALFSVDASALAHETTEALREEYMRNLWLALSAAMLAAGGNVVAPLRLVALPVFAYMGWPAARRIYIAIQEDGSWSALAETIVLGAVVAKGIVLPGALLPGAVGFSLYYLGRRWWLAHAENKKMQGTAILLPPTICVRRAQGEMQIPTTQVQPQERVVYAAGDLVAVAGTIIEGTACLQHLRVTGMSAPAPTMPPTTVVEPGATVAVGDLVLIGRVVVQCQ